MPDTTARLALPHLQPAQAQKHVTHNEALVTLDALVQLTVEGLDATTPPATPVEGAVWALGATPTGDWDGHAGALAAFVDGGWLFLTPGTGWRAWDKATDTLNVFTGGAWSDATGAPDMDNLSGVGVNTSSDPTNRLAVAADATLLTHDGAGHQLKINKAADTDTASLLFQTNWSGRAEMGLAGNDDFSVKVSPDGSTFTEALRMDATTGAVSLPGGFAGSGSAAGALGLQSMAFTCERNTGFYVGNDLAFGNGATLNTGAVMPFAGRVVTATLGMHDIPAGTNTVAMTVNRIVSSAHSVTLNTTGSGVETAVASFAAAPLSFAAGDALGLQVTAKSGNGPAVGTFIVIFD